MAKTPYSNSMQEGNYPTETATEPDRSVVHDGMPKFYSGGAGDDQRSLQDNGTDGKHFSCGGLPSVPKCDYNYQRTDNPKNFQSAYGIGGDEVGHDGPTQGYGVDK